MLILTNKTEGQAAEFLKILNGIELEAYNAELNEIMLLRRIGTWIFEDCGGRFDRRLRHFSDEELEEKS